MSERRKVVLDTNCLIASLSRHSEYYPVWSEFQSGKYILCVSNDILEEYQEIIGQKTSDGLIEADHDDDKFVDCAFAANATYIVSDDKHFDVLKEITFPQLLVLKLKEFLGLLKSENINQ